ncbi:MAG: hypothetical protein AAF570_02530 [Bacteroidota bacterium]
MYVYLLIDEIYENWPQIQNELDWQHKDFHRWVRQGFLKGKNHPSSKKLMIREDTLIAMIEFHNRKAQKRIIEIDP